MKRLVFNSIITGIFLIFLALQNVWAIQTSKQVNRTFTLKPTTEVSVSNKFGNIIIHRWDKNTMEMKVNISVDSKSVSNTQAVLDAIDVKITDRISSGQLYIETLIPESKTQKSSYSINYEINMPGTNKLILSNQFGNVIMGSHTGDLDLSVKFGQLIAEDLKKARIQVEFSNAKCEIESVEAGSVELKYSKMMIGDCGNIGVSSQFSDIEINKAGTIDMDARYGKVAIYQVGVLTGSIQFAGLSISKLTESVRLDAKHGNGISLESVSRNFKSIEIDGQFSPIDISMLGGTQAKLQFDLQFGNLKANGTGINFIKVLKDNTTSQYEGYLESSNASSLVKVNSKYGNIRFEVN